ncbi:hypothetical protein [Phaeobacter gallaeciensis]|uniref:hypothetical protein n=1 Tax=Phaeobacter gallaeciensis TaxID=60890 RepID=UPI000BBC9993|nr:hypothetical protein [Phaeobacter gallaeciensis]ATF20599.1 hypothetical protein PhaeoP129_04010 [Phaeobacter gallaeciensis]ATF24708.1 hypothetical protein PhaeoP128_04011 [Phaeobacter gallaeciensis]
MNIKVTSVSAALAVFASVASAQQQGSAQNGQQGSLPTGIAGIYNLGASGLLESYLSNEPFGIAQTRIGVARAVTGVAHGGGPTSGYDTSPISGIGDFHALKVISPDSFIRFSTEYVDTSGGGSIVKVDAQTYRFDAQYVKFFDPSTMVAFGAFYENTDINNIGVAELSYGGWGLRADALKQFNQNWGVSGRIEYMFGGTDINLPISPTAAIIQKQDDDRLYIQSELVGRFDSSDLNWVPNGWVLNPIFGALYQKSWIEATADNFGNVSSGVNGPTEEYSTIWAKARISKQLAPGTWSPKATLGFEHELTNSLDEYLDEPTYGVVGLGVTYLTKSGGYFDVTYSGRLGLNGIREQNGITIAFTQTF